LLTVGPSRTATVIFTAGAAADVVTAHLIWLLYMLSPFGPAQTVINGSSIGVFYRSLLQ